MIKKKLPFPYKPVIYMQGFMLVEVLVALFIIGLLMAALIKATTDDTRNMIVLKNKTVAAWIAENYLADVQLGNITPAENSDNQVHGKMEMLGQTWYWIVAFQPLSTDQNPVWRVDVDVKPTSFETQSAAHLVSYYYKNLYHSDNKREPHP